MENFCILRIFKKKKVKLLTKQICYIYKEKLENKYPKDKKYRKVWDHYHYAGEYRSAVHSICNLKYIAQKNCYSFS